MTVLEIGHPTWSRPDADRVAMALVDQDHCASVRLIPPDGPCDGWAVVATYLDEPGSVVPGRSPGHRTGECQRGGPHG